jgi:hypothetical protein
VKNYLKNIFSVIFTAALFVIFARTGMAIDLPQAIPQQAPPEQTSPTVQAPAAPPSVQMPANSSAQPTTPDQPAAAQPGAPVQGSTVETDPDQKPTKSLPYYSYAHDEAEYSVSLPDAPTVSTIWQETPDTKAFLRRPPTDHAALGETATYKLVDIDTEEVFDVQIYFLRAAPEFLAELSDRKLKSMLTKKFSEVTLSDEKFSISNGAGLLKWAQLSGFVLDAHHHPAFYALHYLTGTQSILVIQVKYSIENKKFEEYYTHMINSIAYVQP